jgi:tRNA (guanine26-N2/guanine27-N2)-dimethyltransferase
MSTSVPANHVEIVEGTARMLYNEKEAVFYNKVQVLNRDLSIQTIKLFSEIIAAERGAKYAAKKARYDANPADRAPFPPHEGISVLDALAATGLRSIRYMKEIPNLRNISINDLSSEATEAAMVNIRTNGVNPDQVTVHNRDACILMYENREASKNFDVIDIDPYGSAAPFLDAAVQAVAGDGGLLCITCTDTTVLCGNYPEVCFAKYGSMPLKAKYVHEMSLRILLNSIENSANRYKRYIVPWLSLSVDFYVRVFVRVYESPVEVKNSCLKRIMTYQSTQCSSFYVSPLGVRNKSKKEKEADIKAKKALSAKEAARAAAATVGEAKEGEESGADADVGAGGDEDVEGSKDSTGPYSARSFDITSTCEESGGKWKVGGPFWGAPIHDQEVVDTILARVMKAKQIQSAQKEMAASSTAAASTASTTSTPYIAIPTAERLSGMLTSISEELKDVPFHYNLPDLAAILQCTVPTHLNFKSALINAGYRVSHFHHDASAIKTDAPYSVVSIHSKPPVECAAVLLNF